MDKRKWGRRTDQDLRNLLRYLKHQAESEISKENLQKKFTMHGYKHNEYNVFLDEDLAISLSVIMLDWMHIFFIGGCFNLEAWAVLRALFAANLVVRITYKTLASAMTAWITPKSEPDIALLFTKHHNESCKDANMFKCQA